MNFTILMPVFNEKRTVKKVVSEILNQYKDVNLIVVNDGSNDGTEIELNSIDHENYKVLTYSKNQGKGYAIRYGLRYIQKDGVVIFWDGDDELSTSNIHDIIEFYNKNEDCEVLFGSRFLNNNNIKKYGLLKTFINGVLTWLANFLINTELTDMETAVKTFKTRFINSLNLKSDGFEIEPEITYKLNKISKIYEIPIIYKPRTKKEGKKISIGDGFKTLITLFNLSKLK